QGVSGTTGQAAFTVGTGMRTAVSTLNLLTDIGLSASVNVTASTAAIVLATDGGIQINSTSGTAAAVVNILLVVDNTTFVSGRQYIVSNNTGFVGIGNWSFTTSMSNLTQGWHTFKVFAQYAAGSAPVWVGGMQGSLLQGALTVTQVNK